VIESCDELLANPPRLFTTKSSERILYVAQGEVAHAVPLQCDVIVSDKATTCHILGFRSESDDNLPLTSLTHIDGSSYDRCIRAMVREHIVHHKSTSSEEEKKRDQTAFGDSRICLQIHIVGGFEDSKSSSSKISNWLMHLLAQIAEEQKDFLKMILKTCAITSMNDNGCACPIGRGIGIDLRKGTVFLARVEEEVSGPAMQLRSVRVWSQEGANRGLSVIHLSKSNSVRIDAFAYESIPDLDLLLQLPDNIVLQYTSTSPDVEEPGFCGSVRSTLQFLRHTECRSVFGPDMDQPLIFRRAGSSNRWIRIR
jgi:hypothetical protein